MPQKQAGEKVGQKSRQKKVAFHGRYFWERGIEGQSWKQKNAKELKRALKKSRIIFEMGTSGLCVLEGV